MKVKRGLSVLTMCLALLFVWSIKVDAAEVTEAVVDEMYVDYGFAHWMANDGYFSSGETPPEEAVHWYLRMSGALDEYLDRNDWYYRVSYDEYMVQVEHCFTNYTDMKTYLLQIGAYDEATGQIEFYSGGLGGMFTWKPVIRSAAGESTYKITGLFIDGEVSTTEDMKEYHDYLVMDGYKWVIMAVEQLTLIETEDGLKIDAYEAADSYVVDDMYFTNDSEEVAYKLTLDLDAEVSCAGTVGGGAATKETVRITSLDGNGYDYYLWPDSRSTLAFSVQNGYEINKIELTPENAGTMVTSADNNIVTLNLTEPATLKVGCNDLEPDVTEGWQQDEIGWWYLNEDGTYPANKWQLIDGEYYYFNAKGYRVENKWQGNYYLGTDGVMATSTWVGKYYVDETGKYQKGWLKLDEGWYYLGTDGAVKVGWFKVGSTWYYGQAGEKGLLVQNNWYIDGNSTYYFLDSCAMAAGWQVIDGKDYYFGTTGAMYTNNWAGSYWLGEDGAMVVNAWVDADKSYVGADGKYKTGWLELDEGWYYLGTNGVKRLGWCQVKGAWYYFNEEENGIMLEEGLYIIDDKVYAFSVSGAMLTGWQVIDGEWFYFTSSGAGYTGWLKSGGKWYYIEDGYMYYGGVIYIEPEDRWALFNDAGVWIGYIE